MQLEAWGEQEKGGGSSRKDGVIDLLVVWGLQVVCGSCSLGSSSILMEPSGAARKRIKARKLREIGARFNVISAHVGRKHLCLAPVNRMGAALFGLMNKSGPGSSVAPGQYATQTPRTYCELFLNYFMWLVNSPAFIIQPDCYYSCCCCCSATDYYSWKKYLRFSNYRAEKIGRTRV